MNALGKAALDPQRPSAVQIHCIARFLFDHRVGEGEQRWRNGVAKGPRHLQVDDKLELGRLRDG
jgi:hypothetical protein